MEGCPDILRWCQEDTESAGRLHPGTDDSDTTEVSNHIASILHKSLRMRLCTADETSEEHRPYSSYRKLRDNEAFLHQGTDFEWDEKWQLFYIPQIPQRIEIQSFRGTESKPDDPYSDPQTAS